VTALPEISSFLWSKNAKKFVTALATRQAEIILSVKNAVHNEHPRQDEISEEFIVSYVNAAIREKCMDIAPKQMKFLSGAVKSDMKDLQKEHER
jgi:hypothetical protein